MVQGMLADPFLMPDGPWGAMFSLPSIATDVDRYIRKYISDSPNRYREFDKLASLAKPGARDVFINPLCKDESDRLKRFASMDIARALMEGTVYLLKMNVDKLAKTGINALTATIAGGPSETHPWPKIICDILGIPLLTVNGTYAGAVGAAIMAGIGTESFSDVQEAQKILQTNNVLREPNKSRHEEYLKLYEKFKRSYLVD